MKPRIGVLTSGGDCPGLNAVLRGVVLAADKLGWEVVGFRDGFEGLLPPGDHLILDRKSIDGIMPLGGTIIGTTNRGHFVAKVGAGERTIVPPEVIEHARQVLNERGVKTLIIIGGDGSMVTAQQLQEAGINCIGVPKTIDNDLMATEFTFGFDTALHVATDAIDRLHTTAESHHRVMVIEVMGRDAGWIALHSGLAGGADVILIPEIPFTIETVCEAISQREAHGRAFCLVVVAEGVNLPAHDGLGKPFPKPQPGQVGNAIGYAIREYLKKEVRVTVLGHVQRGGSPSPFDRTLATRFGVSAVDLVARGEFGRMVCLRAGKIESVPLADAIGSCKLVDTESDYVRAARAVGITFGDRP